MGIDIFDLTFRIERELKIKLSQNDILDLWKDGGHNDIQIRDFISMVQRKVELQNPTYDGVVFDQVK